MPQAYRTELNGQGTRSKFKHDNKGVAANNADGFVFVTNQELKLAERDELKGLTAIQHLEIYHLERIASILDKPINYGIRLEFLDIEMTKEEQLAFFSIVIRAMNDFRSQASDILDAFSDSSIAENIPTKELAEFKAMLESLVGYSPFRDPLAPMSKLEVPLTELRAFANTLHGLVVANRQCIADSDEY